MFFINMVTYDIIVSTRTHYYDSFDSTYKGKETYDPKKYLHIEKPRGDAMLHILIGVYKCYLHNPISQYVPNYFILEDLTQIPCAMLSLEVIQSYPMQ
jgi:hypothetical protein